MGKWKEYQQKALSMSFEIITTPDFKRELKRLAKRYTSLKDDYIAFLKELQENPMRGKSLGKGLRKIRISITSKGKGKSGGARVISHNTLVSIDEGRIVLVIIYDKSDQESISDKELKQLMIKNGLI